VFFTGLSEQSKKMLVLFETPAGFALFKVLDEGKLSKVEVCIPHFCRENLKHASLDYFCRTFSVGFSLFS